MDGLDQDHLDFLVQKDHKVELVLLEPPGQRAHLHLDYLDNLERRCGADLRRQVAEALHAEMVRELLAHVMAERMECDA